MIVPEQIEAGLTIAAGMGELLQFNGAHEHSYSQEEMRNLVDLTWPYGTGEKSMMTDGGFDAFMEAFGPWMMRADSGNQN